jgi:hypothetical protein
MRTFTATELARLQDTQTGAMQDTCIIQTYSTATTDRYGNPAPTYTPGSPIPCGLDPTADNEVQASGEVGIVDARLRLPIATVINEHDRVQITKRYGVTITAQMFSVFGPPERGPSGLVVNLRTVTT